jgi:hypothetical protein
MNFRAVIFYHGRVLSSEHPASCREPYQFIGLVSSSGHLSSEVDMWCLAEFGMCPNRWNTSRLHTSRLLWQIFGDDDALAFRLRWC